MSGLSLLVNDSHGVYIPQAFVEDYDVTQWGFSEDNEDIKTLQAGPEAEWYWEAWENVLSNAKFVDTNGKHWHLSQDGDLWAYCEELMSDEEYEGFFDTPKTC